jgi:hypothetical protein
VHVLANETTPRRTPLLGALGGEIPEPKLSAGVVDRMVGMDHHLEPEFGEDLTYK